MKRCIGVTTHIRVDAFHAADEMRETLIFHAVADHRDPVVHVAASELPGHEVRVARLTALVPPQEALDLLGELAGRGRLELHDRLQVAVLLGAALLVGGDVAVASALAVAAFR